MNRNEHSVNDKLHCKHCGAELAEDSVFCEQCGKRVKPNKWLFIILAFALLLVGGGLWYYMTHRSGKKPLPKSKPTYTISIKSSDETMGTVNGGGTYDTIITVTIEALANEGYRFVSWNDGNKERQRKVVTDHNQEYEAQFEVERDVTPGSGGEEPTARVVPKFVITVVPSDRNMGTVIGGGTYDSLAMVTIEAKANVGYHFVSWSDGNKKNPRTIKVEASKKYIAKFDGNIEPKPPVEPVVKGSWNGVATYTGTWEGGVPHGSGGKLYFSSDYQLDLKDINGTKLEIKAGETITDVKFVHGKLRQGTLHRNDGTTKWFNI